MSKNLPPAWDHGYALPGNVKAEGVQRRAFVTKWAPRGTYGTEFARAAGGYAQPKYVLEEGTGQGTFVTDWVPSATYMGPGVPHWMNNQPHDVLSAPDASGAQYVKVKSAMGDAGPVPSHVPFAAYGNQAAAHIMKTLAPLPPKQRQAVLKKALDAVDPTLYGKASKVAKGLVARGVPARKAVEMALAHTMTRGFSAEVVKLGKGVSPRKRSLLGLGCYGCGAAMAALGGTGLGGLLDSITSSVQTLASSITKPSAPPPPPSSGPMPPIGACTQAVDATSPTGYQTFIWQDQAYVKQADGTYAMQTVAPFWAPLRAGQTCASQWTGPGGVGTVQQNFGSGGGASVLSTDPTAGFPTPEAQAHLHVGPFSFSGYPDYNGKPGRPGDYKHQDMGFYRFTRPSPAQVIPPAVMKLFTDAVKRGGTAQGKDASGGLFDPYQSTRPTSLATYQRWLAIFGLPDLGPGNFYRALLPVYSYVAAEVQTPSVFEFTWGNKPWYVKFMLAPPAAVFPAWPGDDSYKATNSALAATPDQPLDLLVYVHRKPTGTLQDVGGALDAAGQAVMTVVSGLATIACDILTNPNSVKEGAAVGGAAGATGAAVGGALCGGTSPQPTASSSSGILPWIIGGAAGLTALLILSSPKKKPKPPSGGAPP